MMKATKGSHENSNAPASSNGGSDSNASAVQFKLMLLIGMVLQNSSTVLVGRYTRAGVAKEDQYDVNHLIVIIELGKLILSAILEFHTTSGKLMESIQMHVLDAPYDALKIIVPALLYLIQNTLLYVALSNLTAPLFQVTYQCKLVTTAFVSVVMLQRKYSLQQWICLAMISFGVAIVVLGESKEDSSKKAAATNLVTGLLAVTVACFSSAFAGVYFEYVLKKPATDATSKPSASLWMRNIQLSFFSIVIALVQGMFKEQAVGNSYLHGFNFWAWVLVLLQAGGGLLVAAVIKYADNVLKGLATGVSVVLATACSMVLFDTPITTQFFMGGFMILTSVYFFSNPLPSAILQQLESKKQKNGDDDKVEVKSLLPK